MPIALTVFARRYKKLIEALLDKLKERKAAAEGGGGSNGSNTAAKQKIAVLEEHVRRLEQERAALQTELHAAAGGERGAKDKLASDVTLLKAQLANVTADLQEERLRSATLSTELSQAKVGRA